MSERTISDSFDIPVDEPLNPSVQNSEMAVVIYEPPIPKNLEEHLDNIRNRAIKRVKKLRV